MVGVRGLEEQLMHRAGEHFGCERLLQNRAPA
jgi:hypothetical protein